MAYPNIILTRRMRIAFMVCLMLVFFIAAPLIILFTAGYRYDFATHTVKETGVISIDVLPRDADVYLNDIKINQRIPIRLANRAPGLYQVSIRRDGYQAWEKDVEVKSKQTTYIRNISLFPHTSPQKLRQFPYAIVAAAFSPDGRYLLTVSREKTVYEIRLHDTISLEETTIARDVSDEPPIVSWSPTDAIALVVLSQGESSYAHLFSASRPDATKVYSYQGTDRNKEIHWSNNSNNPAVFIRSSDNTIHTVNMTQWSPHGTSTSSVWHANANTNAVWHYDTQTALLARQENGKERIYSVPITIKEIIDATDARLIVRLPDNTIAVIPFSDQQPGEVKSLPTTFVKRNAATGDWISWSDSEIWNIYADGSTSLLNRTSESIESVAGLDPYGVLLIKTKNGIVAFNPGYYTTHTLLPLKSPAEPLGVNMRTKQLLFVGQVNNEFGLYRLNYGT